MNAEPPAAPGSRTRRPCAIPERAAGCQPNSGLGPATSRIRSRQRSGVSPAPNN